MNLIKVKDVVFDFDKVIGFEPYLSGDYTDVYLCNSGYFFRISLSVSEFCDLLKFYNIDIKELK